MLKRLACLAGTWLLGTGLLPQAATAQTAPSLAAVDAPELAGEWSGPLSIPGGTVPIQINVVQAAANKLIATLDLPAKRLNRIPASITLRGDTLLFYAARADSRFVCVQTADGRELRGIWSQPGLRVPLTLGRAGSKSNVVAGQPVAVVATTYHIEEVKLTSEPGSISLAGTLSIPDGKGPFPAAVLLSDMGSQDRDARQGSYRFFADLASNLARQGIAVLRLDDRGVGQSGGSGRAATTADLVHDAQAGLSYLRLRPSIDPARTGLIGHGEGGNVALLAAGQPEPPSFVVTLAASGISGLELLANQPEPVTSPADTAQAGVARQQAWAAVLAKAAALRTSGSNAAQVETYIGQQRLKFKNEDHKQAEATVKFRKTMFEIVRQTVSDDQTEAIVVNMLRQRYPNQDPALARSRAVGLLTPWYRHYLNFDPQASLAEVQCPVLLLNGSDDAEVNASVNLAALEKGLKANKRVTVRRLPDVNHFFQTPAAERLADANGQVDPVIYPVLIGTIRDWILQQVGK